MANLSELTRKEQVLTKLREADGDWVNTTDIANAFVGGSEGARRIRELRAEGYNIERRRHPDPDISQWQYRLVGGDTEPPPERPARAIDLPYVHWSISGMSARSAMHNGWVLYLHRLWTGEWQWDARKGQVIHKGKSGTLEDAKRDATLAAMK